MTTLVLHIVASLRYHNLKSQINHVKVQIPLKKNTETATESKTYILADKNVGQIDIFAFFLLLFC